MKTNAARILDGLGITYELRAYEVDPDDLTAESVAQKVGLPAEQVFKTLVARGDKKGVCLAIVPGNAELAIWILALIVASLVCWISDTLGSADWQTFFLWTTAAYLISRGIAKASRVYEV